jgi:hypothetical protein
LARLSEANIKKKKKKKKKKNKPRQSTPTFNRFPNSLTALNLSNDVSLHRFRASETKTRQKKKKKKKKKTDLTTAKKESLSISVNLPPERCSIPTTPLKN